MKCGQTVCCQARASSRQLLSAPPSLAVAHCRLGTDEGFRLSSGKQSTLRLAYAPSSAKQLWLRQQKSSGKARRPETSGRMLRLERSELGMLDFRALQRYSDFRPPNSELDKVAMPPAGKTVNCQLSTANHPPSIVLRSHSVKARPPGIGPPGRSCRPCARRGWRCH